MDLRNRGWLLWLTLLAGAPALAADPYPNQPIRLIVPWPAGGGVDTSARIIAQPLADRLKTSIVIDNHGGAGGNIGTEMAAHAKADGYTLLMASSSPNAINMHLYSRLGFDPLKDFLPIALVGEVPNLLVVPPTSPFNSAQELIANAKANPGKLNYGSAGVGSSQHLAAAMLVKATGINIVHVPYKGTSPAEQDLMAGHVSMLLDTTAALPFIAGNKMKPLAVAAKKRIVVLSTVPTFDEIGVPGVYCSAWYGVMAPAGTPKEIITRVNAEINAVLQTAEVKKRFVEFGGDIGGGTPESFGQFNEAEIKRYADIVKMSGAKLE